MSDRRAAKVFFPLLVPVLVASGPACSTGNDGADSDGSGSTASASGGGELGAGGNAIGGSNSGGANGGAAAGGQQSSGGASGGPASGGSAAGGAASGGSAAGGAATGGSAPACESAADAGPAPSADAVSVVDPNQRYQTTEGWGTSLCWFGNVIGGWSDVAQTELADLLFDDEAGLGLNIVRYNIGGGDAPGHDHMGYGKEMPGVKATENAEFDFSADQNQINLLLAATDRIDPGSLIVEGFSNSPPYWMTESGCASGADGGGSNLKSDYYDDFADFLSQVTLHFRDELNIPFRTVEPLNEPNADWWNAQGGQEGCHFSRSEQARIIGELRGSLDAHGLSEVEIAASDETSIDDAVATYQSFDDATRAALAQVNTHIYSGSQRDALRSLVKGEGKRLWSSEADGSGAPEPFDVYPHNHDDIVPGLDIAQRITRDLRQMQADAFIFWQAVESEQAQISLNKNWGLLHGDFEGSGQSVALTKKYHVMHQYTAFIRPGDVMIDIDDQDAVAFFNEAEGKVVIVQRRAEMSPETRAYDLSAFSSLGAQARVLRSSGSESFEELEAVPVLEGKLVVDLPPQSVTTLVLDCSSL